MANHSRYLMKEYKQALAEHTRAIIFEENYQFIYKGIYGLLEIFSSLSGVNAGDIVDEDIMLSAGKAVSTIKAAHCLREIERTRRFLRGIKKAIDDVRVQKPDSRINILYAGCGPYATLLTPLTSLYTSDQLSFTLLDINAYSLQAVQSLYEALGLTAYIKKILHEDAITYKIDAEDDYDLVISETMHNALRGEPQVSIMANLIPQLKPGAVFIPEEIRVNAALLDRRAENASFLEVGKAAERVQLGTVYKTSRPMEYPLPVKFPLPAIDKHSRLSLLTEINVYATEKLENYNCSLTLPYRIADLPVGKSYEAVEFEYVVNENPHFAFQLT